MSRAIALVVLAALASCATVEEKKATTASDAHDRAACEKMCEVAGDAEHNADAVAGCQQKCATSTLPSSPQP